MLEIGTWVRVISGPYNGNIHLLTSINNDKYYFDNSEGTDNELPLKVGQEEKIKSSKDITELLSVGDVIIYDTAMESKDWGGTYQTIDGIIRVDGMNMHQIKTGSWKVKKVLSTELFEKYIIDVRGGNTDGQN